MDINLSESTIEAANYKLDTLLQLFPQGDFKFLREKCLELGDDSAFQDFVDNALTSNVVPMTREDLHENDVAATNDFDVAEFLEKCPDPFAYFDTLQRTDNLKVQMVEILKDRFRDVQSCFIENVLIQENYSLLRTASYLVDVPLQWKLETLRQDSDVNLNNPLDPDLQKEVQLLDHREEIENYVKLMEEMKINAIQEGQVWECECCYSSDILNCDVITCTEGHIFCKECVKKSAEVRIGDGQVTFPCIHDCRSGGIIQVESMKAILDSKLYNKIVARIQEEEVKLADIPGIEHCQRCEYAAVLDENITKFKCAKCNFELCRLCNKQSHVPRKCGETVDEDIRKQQRKQHEELETATVLRRCGACKKPYVKIEGCNKVTCTCGTANCYLCGASGIDYSHRCFVDKLWI